MKSPETGSVERSTVGGKVSNRDFLVTNARMAEINSINCIANSVDEFTIASEIYYQ